MKRGERNSIRSGEKKAAMQRRGSAEGSKHVPSHSRCSRTSLHPETRAALFRTSSSPFVQMPASQGVQVPIRYHHRDRTNGFWNTVMGPGIPSGMSASSRAQTTTLSHRTEENSTSSSPPANKPPRKVIRQAGHGKLPRARRGNSLDVPTSAQGTGQTLGPRSRDAQKSKGRQFEVYKRYRCGQCDQRFFQKHRFDNHVKSFHDGKEGYICPFCPARHLFKETLIRHSRDIHGRSPAYCKYCKISFKAYEGLEKHDKKFHSEARSRNCDRCPSHFGLLSDLNRHYRVAHGSRVNQR